MKKHLTLFTLFLVSIYINAQTIPNGNFENWTAGNPDMWSTYNDLGALLGLNPLPVTQESPAPSGNFYLKATVRFSSFAGENIPGLAILGNTDLINGTGAMGIPFIETPAYFTGIFKHDMVTATDSMIIGCQLTKWDPITNSQILVGGIVGYNFINSVSQWTPFSYPIQYESTETPDTLTIVIASLGGDGAAVSVDNLGFSSNGIGLNELQTAENSVTLFPNPAVDRTILNLTGIQEDLAQGLKIEVIDLTGRIVETHLSVRNPLFELNTSNLESGKYVIRITNSNITVCKSLVKQ